MKNRPLETFCMQTFMYTSEDCFAEFQKDGIKCIDKLWSHCANVNFSDKSRYDRTSQQVTHKGGESAMNYI